MPYFLKVLWTSYVLLLQYSVFELCVLTTNDLSIYMAVFCFFRYTSYAYLVLQEGRISHYRQVFIFLQFAISKLDLIDYYVYVLDIRYDANNFFFFSDIFGM